MEDKKRRPTLPLCLCCSVSIRLQTNGKVRPRTQQFEPVRWRESSKIARINLVHARARNGARQSLARSPALAGPSARSFGARTKRARVCTITKRGSHAPGALNCAVAATNVAACYLLPLTTYLLPLASCLLPVTSYLLPVCSLSAQKVKPAIV